MKKWLVWLSRINFIGICWFAAGIIVLQLQSFAAGVFLTGAIIAAIGMLLVCVLLGIPMFYLGWKNSNP